MSKAFTKEDDDAPEAKVIHADIDPAEISKNRTADVPIVGDCLDVITDLIVAIQAEQMLYTKRMFQERVAHHTGQDQAQIEADSDRDRWFTAEEAKDYGFIDKVITGATQVPEGAGTLS